VSSRLRAHLSGGGSIGSCRCGRIGRGHQILLDAVLAGHRRPLDGHVHFAPRGIAGPIVIDLDTDDVGGPDLSGCRVITTGLAAAITSDPGAYYVNLHNTGFQAGAIRGQLK
jgi:hypothetical protein